MRFHLPILLLALMPTAAPAQTADPVRTVTALFAGYVAAAEDRRLVPYILDHSATEVLAAQAATAGRTLPDFLAAATAGYDIAMASVETSGAHAVLPAVFGTSPLRPWAVTPFSMTTRNLTTSVTRTTCRYIVAYQQGGTWFIQPTQTQGLSDQFLAVFPDMEVVQALPPPVCPGPTS